MSSASPSVHCDEPTPRERARFCLESIVSRYHSLLFAVRVTLSLSVPACLSESDFFGRTTASTPFENLRVGTDTVY